MNIYSKKQKIKLSLFFIAVLIGVGAIWYSGYLVKKLSAEERKKVELWAETMKEVLEMSFDTEISPTLSKILADNKTIPVILADENDNIISYINLNPRDSDSPENLKNILQEMKSENEPIVINFSEGNKNTVYYHESVLLTNLFYYPYIQISVIAIFVVVAFSSSRKAEENQVWVGMSKETAHQLGTPISSLVAWVELLKLKNEEDELVTEVEKDVRRLETITERFSKIGSAPKLKNENINEVLINSITYLKSRTSRKVEYVINTKNAKNIAVPVNVSLFEWVIENICKNAIDAMNGQGKIFFTVIEKSDTVIIDIADTGKGIPKSKYKTVFKPGYTSKKRGWGLGLSLAKRIIETYHAGKIFVKSPESGKGATFRIILKNLT